MQMKKLASNLINGYEISLAKTRLSFITFGDSVEQPLSFADSTDSSTVHRYLDDKVTRVKGDRNFDQLSEYVISNVFNPRRGSRAGVGRALVLFTMKPSQNDVDSDDNKARSTLANRLTKLGVKLVVVGINREDTNDVSGLKPITGNPKNVIPVPNMGLLTENFGRIEKRIIDAVGMLHSFLISFCFILQYFYQNPYRINLY